MDVYDIYFSGGAAEEMDFEEFFILGNSDDPRDREFIAPYIVRAYQHEMTWEDFVSQEDVYMHFLHDGRRLFCCNEDLMEAMASIDELASISWPVRYGAGLTRPIAPMAMVVERGSEEDLRPMYRAYYARVVKETLELVERINKYGNLHLRVQRVNVDSYNNLWVLTQNWAMLGETYHAEVLVPRLKFMSKAITG